MRKFLTCALCFVPTLAGAITLYYDKTGECNGWWSGTTQTGCPASNLRVKKFHPTTEASKVFNGIVINGETLVDYDGTLRSFNTLSEATKSQMQADEDAGESLAKYKQEYPADDVVTVQFDARGGFLPGTISRQMGRGATLPTITEAREDGAIFDGWAKGDPNSTKVTSISDDVTDNTTYYARWTCPNGLTMNQHGTCVDTTGNTEYIDRSGNPVSSGNLNCWRYENGRYVNYCYWRVDITFHDKPDIEEVPSASEVQVTSGNDGLVLECNGGFGCKESQTSAIECAVHRQPNNLATACIEINNPKANGYYFRGYYLKKKDKGLDYRLPEDIIAYHTTKEGGAFNNFYPKNQSNETFRMADHAIVVMSTEPVQTVCPSGWQTGTDGNQYCPGIQTSALLPIDVYGGWARKCDPTDVAHSNDGCHVAITNGDYFACDSDGFCKGDVKYFANCREGYYQPVTSNAYNNIQCVGDNGQRLYKYTGIQCSPNDNTIHTCNAGFNLPVAPECANSYTFKGWRVGGEKYVAGAEIGCNATALPHGSNGYAEIRTIECAPCVAPEHGFCQSSSDPFVCTTARCNNGYTVCKTGDSTDVTCVPDGTPCGFYCPSAENLTLTDVNMSIVLNNANLEVESCKYKISCAKGYILTGDTELYNCTGDGCDITNLSAYINDTYQCSPQGGGDDPTEPDFECPTTFMSSSYRTVQLISNENGVCSYEVSCTDDYNLYPDNDGIITCSAQDECANLNSLIAAYSCVAPVTPVSCPTAPEGWDANGTLVNLTSGTYDCNYKLTCNSFFVVTGTSNADTTFGCNGSNCTEEWLTEMKSNKYCQVQCQSPQTLNDLLENGNFGENVTRIGHDKCRYTLGCESNYTLTGSNPYTCTGAGCKKNAIRTDISSGYACVSTFTCPQKGTDFQEPNNMTISDPVEDTDTQTCTYSLSCNTGYAFQTESSPVAINCTGSQCDNGQHITSEIAEHECHAILNADDYEPKFKAGSNTGTIDVDCSLANGTKCRITPHCDLLLCDPGLLSQTNFCDGGSQICGNDMECGNIVLQ